MFAGHGRKLALAVGKIWRSDITNSFFGETPVMVLCKIAYLPVMAVPHDTVTTWFELVMSVPVKSALHRVLPAPL